MTNSEEFGKITQEAYDRELSIDALRAPLDGKIPQGGELNDYVDIREKLTDSGASLNERALELQHQQEQADKLTQWQNEIEHERLKAEAAANQWKADAVELLAAIIGLMIAVGVTVGIIWILYVIIKTIWLYVLIGGICGYIGHKL